MERGGEGGGGTCTITKWSEIGKIRNLRGFTRIGVEARVLCFRGQVNGMFSWSLKMVENNSQLYLLLRRSVCSKLWIADETKTRHDVGSA